MGTYTIQISGQAIPVNAGSLIIDNTIGKRGQASFTAHTTTDFHFQQDQQVEVFDATNTLVFSGYIAKPKEQQPGFQRTLNHTIQCVDQGRLGDKRIIAEAFVYKTCGYIVQYIVDNILSAEGVTVGQIYDGIFPSSLLYPDSTLYPLGNVGFIPNATFAYSTVSQALDALVQAASANGVPYYWAIDCNKQIWFVPYTAITNGTLVDGTQIDQKYNPPSVQRQNPTYRNKQYLLGGVAQTSPQTEFRAGDGSTTSWNLLYDLASAPQVYVNNFRQTIGIKNIDVGRTFYWEHGNPTITQDNSVAKLTNAQTLKIIYIGQYPTTIISANQAQIDYESDLDGTSGMVEQVQTDTTIVSVDDGFDKAGRLLNQYGVQATQLTFTTLQSGFAAGQLIQVDLPNFALNNVQMLIEQVSGSDQTDGINIWYAVTAVVGPYDVTWIDFFNRFIARASQTIAANINIGVNQAITTVVTTSATLHINASLTVSVFACPLASSALFPSSSLFPC